jgi:outer membrane receptor protein involved in Fe transport
VQDSLDLSAAIRVTDYSTSGNVTTWKVGASYSPVQDLRFRATISRDIRAPHRQELFADGIFTGNVIVDPFHGNTLLDVQSLLQGNINLEPEEADTFGFGVVYQPSWLQGFSAAVDYYDIEISDAIGTVGRQQTVDRCFRGEQVFCDNLVLDANGFITIVKIQPSNFVSQRARGLDIEASYQRPLWQGDVTLRALATHYLENFQDTGSGPTTDTVGENRRSGPPDWRYRLSAAYDKERFRISLTGNGVSSGVYSNTNIVCTTACPDSSSIARTVNTNDIDGAIYWDVGLTYRVPELAGSESELFLVVQNVTDKDPEIIAEGPGGVAFSTPPSNGRYYDVLGRSFRVGFRANF